jgi:hypothetical protein
MTVNTMKNKLFCDLKTNQEKLEFFRAGRGYDTGIVSEALQEELITVYSQLVDLEQVEDAINLLDAS